MFTSNCKFLFLQVEYCYPPLEPSLFQKEPPNETSQQKHNIDEKDILLESVQLPSIWQTLPSLAIPDGAHNFDSDTVFFHLPHPEDWTKTTYCVACYRQISTKVRLFKCYCKLRVYT